MKQCCICGANIRLGHDFLCYEHWLEYREQMNEPWLKYLMSTEQKERRYRRKSKQFISTDTYSEIEDRGQSD